MPEGYYSDNTNDDPMAGESWDFEFHRCHFRVYSPDSPLFGSIGAGGFLDMAQVGAIKLADPR